MSTREDLSKEIQALSGETAELAKKAQLAVKKATKLAQEDVIPTRFTGIVRSYRYAAGKKGEMPSHRFELECGQGLWLFVSCSSAYFDKFMMTMDMGEKPVGKALNGKVIGVKRQPGDNQLIPEQMYGDALGTDANGKMIYTGAKVRVASVEGTIVSGELNNGSYVLKLAGVEGFDDGDYSAYAYDCIRLD